MKDKFEIGDFLSPLENIEETLEMLNSFYQDERFIDMEDAKKLIESYEEAVKVLKETDL